MVSEQLVPDLANEVQAEASTALKKASSVVITTDGWTSKATENFIALTGHFILGNKFQSVTIGVEKLTDQTAAGHVTAIKNILSKHEGLLPKVHTMISDNAEVMKCTARLLKLFWFGCFPHTLNLVVKDGLKIVECATLLSSVRELSSHFKRSSKASERLREVQKNLKIPQHRIIRDVETRWSSTCNMLQRFLEQNSAIQVVCGEHGYEFNCPAGSEVQELRKLREILEPFREVTTCMSSETNVTASSVFDI